MGYNFFYFYFFLVESYWILLTIYITCKSRIHSLEETAKITKGSQLMVQSCFRRSLDWMWGRISLVRGWPNPGTDFLQRWLLPQACHFLRGIWSMSLITYFDWSGQAIGQGDHCRCLANEVFYAIYSNLPINILISSVQFC